MSAMFHQTEQNNITEVIGGFQIPSLADAYVRGGNSFKTQNFGTEDTIDVKQCLHPDNAHMNRRALVRFSLAGLKDVNIAFASLRLYAVAVQISKTLTRPSATLLASVYEDSWDETTVTYESCTGAGKTVAETYVTAECWNLLDVTAPVKEAVAAGKDEISFLLSGLESDELHMRFSSREAAGENGPALRIITDAEALKNPVLKATDAIGIVEDIHKYANDIVTEYRAWYKEHAEGKVNATAYSRTWGDMSEYNLESEAGPRGSNNIPFSKQKSRSLSSLENFSTESEAAHSEYGGRMDVTLDATGFFRVEKIGDRWWLIDPEGHPYMAAGMGYVCPGTSDGQRAVSMKIYGSDARWAEDAANTLKNDFGFTAVTHISRPDLLNQTPNKIPYSHTHSFLSHYARNVGAAAPGAGHHTFCDNGTMPVFDPMFTVHCDMMAKKITAEFKDDPYFLGYMSDNELPISTLMLDNSITLDPENGRSVYTYAVAHAWLRAMTGKESVSTADITDELRGKYCEFVYDWYFKVVTEAIRKYDQNHLYLGCRFMYPGYTHECFIRAAGRWCDVLTMNYYFVWEAEPETVKMWAEVSGRPFMITEFYLKGMDSGLPNTAGAGWSGKTQKDRADYYSSYVLKLVESGQCVGWSWLQYWDNDPNNPKADPTSTNANKGIYNSKFEMYTTLTDRMREVNTCMYALADYFDARQ